MVIGLAYGASQTGGPHPVWFGVFHAVSAFNNAGFSTWPDSMTRFSADAWVLVPLMLCIIIGGLGSVAGPLIHVLLPAAGPVSFSILLSRPSGRRMVDQPFAEHGPPNGTH